MAITEVYQELKLKAYLQSINSRTIRKLVKSDKILTLTHDNMVHAMYPEKTLNNGTSLNTVISII